MERGECSGSSASPQGNPFDGITPYASSPSPAAVMKKRQCDVFINHRGCDTKHTLASTIYHTLHLIKINAFLDVEKLELGDSIPAEIQEAMRTAGLHIAIFSPKYAESPWCLAELSNMLHTATPIIPVFYHVDPNDLRWAAEGKGCYAPAFSQHEEKGRYHANMLHDWKMALQKVSNLSGYVLNTNIGDEELLLKSIVNSALKMLRKVPLEVAKHPVGMDEIVQDFERALAKENDEGVQIVGIVGLGGSGKTTLATEVYNRKCPSTKRSSFLHDVRDAASRNVLHTKQKKLLEDIRIETESFDNVKEGKAKIADGLRSLCVLVVLDDVDHENQLDALLPPKESLGRGSLVIITTRDVEVLTKCGFTSIYKAKPLQHLHAEQLFCWHAFLQPFPLHGFEDLVERFLNSCSGLPLSVKVIGGQLYGKRSREYWVSQLKKVRRILPSDISKILKVSYDALDEEEQEIFLDIACFFIGESRSWAIDIWDASGWSGLCSWKALQNKCLVESYEDFLGKERIRMHDHLRDLGRQIAKTHSPQRIRIEKGSPFRGLAGSEGRRVRFEPGHLGKAIESTEKYAELLRGVLWLEWRACKDTSIPTWLGLDTIIVLELDKAEWLETLWEDARPPLQLRELRIDGARRLQSLPRSIGRLQNLKILSIRIECLTPSTRLSSLPEELCELQLLEHLVLEGCDALSGLPDQNRFGDLVNLRHLDLRGCRSLKRLPESFKQLIHLIYLNLDGCRSLESLENITNLKAVYFCEDVEFEDCPVGQLSLRFSSRCIGRLLPIICQLSELKELHIEDGFRNSNSLTNLEVQFCDGLQKIEFSRMSTLQNLKIQKCQQLYEISNLVSLTKLEVKGCRNLQKIEFSQMSILQNLTIQRCPQLYDISNLAGLVSLTNLEVKYCHSLQKIEFSQMSSLQNLRIEACPQLYEISNLAGLVSLTNLEVKYCHSLQKIEFSQMSSLQNLTIEACSLKIEGLEHLTSLENLVLWSGWRRELGIIDSLWGLERLERLQTLNLRSESISAYGDCIQNIEMENWPREITICGRSFYHFESVLDSFTFPGVDVHRIKEWSSNLSSAVVACYLLQCHHYSCEVRIRKAESTRVRLPRPERWIVMSVFKEDSYRVEDGGGGLLSLDVVGRGQVKVLGGWVMVGDGASILNRFKQLFQTLSK